MGFNLYYGFDLAAIRETLKKEDFETLCMHY
jgi:hypothetical protein